ncbi:MAG: hypothetical protein MZW92_68125 [Comamonadaceae bacterium]|nr:hypothetical protein [Comamonadaceae bacterium]
MRVCDPAWIGMKLRKLLSYGETNGAFLAPGARFGEVAALALDDRLPGPADDPSLRDAGASSPKAGHPVANAGILALPAQGQEVASARRSPAGAARVRQREPDPPGRVRFLHDVRPCRCVRLSPPQGQGRRA